MSTLSELNWERDNLIDLVARDICDYGNVRESNTLVNNSSRRVIHKMHDHYGVCWLGKINRHKQDLDKPFIYQHDPLVMVYNFGADFVMPKFDQQLLDLLTERQNATYTNTSDDLVRLNAINARLAEIDGIHLIWS